MERRTRLRKAARARPLARGAHGRRDGRGVSLDPPTVLLERSFVAALVDPADARARRRGAVLPRPRRRVRSGERLADRHQRHPTRVRRRHRRAAGPGHDAPRRRTGAPRRRARRARRVGDAAHADLALNLGAAAPSPASPRWRRSTSGTTPSTSRSCRGPPIDVDGSTTANCSCSSGRGWSSCSVAWRRRLGPVRRRARPGTSPGSVVTSSATTCT